MFIKKTGEMISHKNIYCGEIAELLLTKEYPNLSIAMAFDIKPTIAHYHTKFDEVYMVIDGDITLRLFDPKSTRTWTEKLKANELCLIGKEIHHQIISASEKNRLCIVYCPSWQADDEYPSTILGEPSHS